MNLIFGYFPYFIALVVVLNLWAAYDQYRFMRFDGNLKRGLMVGTEPLTWEMRQFLETLPSSVRYDQGFIRKEINEVLIAGQKPGWSRFFQRRNSMPHLAYINLSDPQNQIEFRASFSFLISVTVGVLFFLLIFFDIFLRSSDGFELPLFLWFFPVIILGLMVGSIVFSHHRERKRLLAILRQAMEQKN
ncbi:MAG: hypothetical protein HYR94_07035 [Chloroflexi bacterium]|nr:hypothetical protein [Chloroflexota bacterium]